MNSVSAFCLLCVGRSGRDRQLTGELQSYNDDNHCTLWPVRQLDWQTSWCQLYTALCSSILSHFTIDWL